MLADAFHELGRANFSYIPRAIASCEQSARLAPRDAQTWNNLAKVRDCAPTVGDQGCSPWVVEAATDAIKAGTVCTLRPRKGAVTTCDRGCSQAAVPCTLQQPHAPCNRA